MGLTGIGVDILYTPRILDLLRRRGSGRLARRILSTDEHQQWSLLSNQEASTRFLTTRWAVKEAVYKALQPDLRPTWKDISLEVTAKQPCLHVNPSLCRRLIKLQCSVSHDGDYILAFVTAEAIK